MIYPYEVEVISQMKSYDLRKCEEYIDDKLAKSWAEGERRTIYPDWYRGASSGSQHPELIRAMYSKYKKAGWIVRNLSDVGLEFYAPPKWYSLELKSSNASWWKCLWIMFKAKVKFLFD